MRKISRILITSIIISVISVVPALAAEPNPTIGQIEAYKLQNTAQLNAEVADLIKKAHGNPEGPQWSNHMVQVQNNIAKYYLAADQNYVNYLQQIVVNKQETERVKLEIVNNYKSLANVNAEFAALLPAAQAEYQAAVNDRVNAQLAVQNARALLGIK